MRHETGLWDGAVFIPMTDARRMEVYTAVYEASDLNCVLPVLPKVLEPGDFRYYAQESKVVFAGSGAAKWRNHCEWAEQALFLEHLFPRAEGMGSLALDAYKKRQFEDVAYFEPFYLKQFQPGKGSVT
jgi:tRNA threonylcarbamoyladenosine biosynthesis protein TsaB